MRQVFHCKMRKLLQNATYIISCNSRQFVFCYSYFIQSRVFYPQLTLRQLIQLNLESRFIVRSQLGLSIQPGSSPSAGLQVVTQSTHLLKDCYPQLVLNPHRSEIRPPKQLDYRCMPLHPLDLHSKALAYRKVL